MLTNLTHFDPARQLPQARSMGFVICHAIVGIPRFHQCFVLVQIFNIWWIIFEKTLQKVVIACNNQSAKAPQLCEFHTHGWMRSKVKMRKRQERKEHTFSINRQTYWQILHHFSMLFFPFSMGNLVGKLPSARQYWILPTWWGSQTDPVVIFRALRGKSPKSRCF